MTTPVQDVINRARILLVDPDGIRWTDTELVGWVNDAQRSIAVVKPNASATTASFACAAGTKQTLPADALYLIDVVRNLGGTRRAIRCVARSILDAESPDWHGAAEVSICRAFAYDDRQGVTFYVFPPLAAATAIEVVYSTAPAAVTLGGSLTIPDMYSPAVLDYIMYRALSKDVDYAANVGQAETYRVRFLETLGMRDMQESAHRPRDHVLESRGAVQREQK